MAPCTFCGALALSTFIASVALRSTVRHCFLAVRGCVRIPLECTPGARSECILEFTMCSFDSVKLAKPNVFLVLQIRVAFAILRLGVRHIQFSCHCSPLSKHVTTAVDSSSFHVLHCTKLILFSSLRCHQSAQEAICSCSRSSFCPPARLPALLSEGPPSRLTSIATVYLRNTIKA